MGGGTMQIDLPFIHIKQYSSSSSSSSSSNSGSKNNNLNLPFPVSSSNVVSVKPSCSASYCFCGRETCRKQEAVYGNQDKRASGSLFSSVFGPVPSQFEVKNAIAALLNFMQGITSSQSESELLEKILDCCVTRKLLSYGHRRVHDAFQLLQTDPSVKRLVVSLSSDKALWDAVTNNDLVRKLWEPPSSGLPQNSNQEPELGACFMRWIMDITKEKVKELIEKFVSLMNEMFVPPETQRKNPAADNMDQFEEKVRSSLLLAVVILLIVVVTRFHEG